MRRRVLGPVVQSIVSLTSSLRGQLVKCFRTVEKMREAFATPKNVGEFQILTFEVFTKC